MKLARTILLGAVVLLSLATGITKLVRMPAEMELFGGAGFPDAATIAFGVVQVVGGLLLIVPATRRVGAVVMAVTFAVASGVVFANGMIVFGLVSLSFIAAAVVFAFPAPSS